MDATLHALGRIVLYGLPTSFLVILLCIYLKVMYFKPFQKMLAERYEATEGARKAAAEQRAARMATVQKFYVDNNIIQKAVPVEELYTNEFVG